LGCHLFIPLFDPSYDTYESLKERSPWTFDAILAIAAKIRSGNGPLSGTFYKCLEEAQGIARSSLFGPVVRKEAVQGMLLLAAWSTNGWLPSGHAMRMALDLGLHRALEKLADNSGKQRTEEEERNLGKWFSTLFFFVDSPNRQWYLPVFGSAFTGLTISECTSRYFYCLCLRRPRIE
jgi:hypothetical protein